MTHQECVELGHHMAKIRTVFERNIASFDEEKVLYKLNEFARALYDYLSKQDPGAVNVNDGRHAK